MKLQMLAARADEPGGALSFATWAHDHVGITGLSQTDRAIGTAQSLLGLLIWLERPASLG